jgi:hypothetical protein
LHHDTAKQRHSNNEILSSYKKLAVWSVLIEWRVFNFALNFVGNTKRRRKPALPHTACSIDLDELARKSYKV